jgi:hypothetical protein
MGGYAARKRAGWMWDLTISRDHDFYIAAGPVAVLAHNCPGYWGGGAGNVEEGNAARDAIAARYPGARTEVHFPTTAGLRVVDVLTPEGEAIESKVGSVSLNSVIRGQIAKDQLVMQEPQITGVRWIFSANKWGEAGPTGPLASALEDAGIQWEIMSP